MTRKKAPPAPEPLQAILVETYEGFVPDKRPWRRVEITRESDREQLAELQKLTGNGLIEFTPPINEYGDRLVVNEEGWLLRLPVNQFATILATPILPPGSYILGPALIVGNHTPEGQTGQAQLQGWEDVLEMLWERVPR